MLETKSKSPINHKASILVFGVWAACVMIGQAHANVDDDANTSENSFKMGGYLRAWSSWNLKDNPQTSNDDRGQLSMLRGTLSLNATGKVNNFIFYANVRTDQEKLTSFQRNLQDMIRTNTPGGPGSDLRKELSQTELREFYVDTTIGDRVKLRLGKQQVVWGETDFFHPSDVLQGFDYRWRQFLEGESDELRKPLIMANVKIDIPEANGNLQLIYRPGFDRKKDIGNTYDLYGGRWMPQPFSGQDFLTLLPYDVEHPKGNYKDATGGFRWSGVTDQLNYSISYATTFQGDPVVNPITSPYEGKTPTGVLGNFFFPKISVFSASVSGDVTAIDAIVNAEVALQHGNLYNSGVSTLPLPGWGPVYQKDVVKTTLRVDKQLRLQDLLGTNQTSLASVQLFDSWIQDFDKNENLVSFAGYHARLKEHDAVLTAFIILNYWNSKLNPQFAVGRNLNTGDVFFIPSISYQYGNNWRFAAEADIFYPKNQRYTPAQVAPTSYPLADFLANKNQFQLRATYQF